MIWLPTIVSRWRTCSFTRPGTPSMAQAGITGSRSCAPLPAPPKTGGAGNCSPAKRDTAADLLVARADDGLGLDLDQQRRVNQAADLDHRRGRSNVTEERAMRRANGLPVGDVGHVDARPHDVAHAGS